MKISEYFRGEKQMVSLETAVILWKDGIKIGTINGHLHNQMISFSIFFFWKYTS